MSEKQSWFRISAAADDGSSEVWILDEIGLWGVRAVDFVKAFLPLRKSKSISVHVNSPGGDLPDALAIYNVIRSVKDKVTVYVDGWAASAASLVAISGKQTVMAANSMLMIHNPSLMTYGDEAEHQKSVRALQAAKEGMLNSYVEKTGMGKDEISALLDQETWMTAQEAVDMGFADSVGDEVPITAKFDPYKFSVKREEVRVTATTAAVAEQIESDCEKENVSMADKDKETPPAVTVLSLRAEHGALVKDIEDAAVASAVKAERARCEGIIGAAYEGQEKLVAKLIADGTDESAAMRAIIADHKENGAKVLKDLEAKSKEIDVSASPPSDKTAEAGFNYPSMQKGAK